MTFNSCKSKNLLDISGNWSGSIKFKTEIPRDAEKPDGETAGAMFTVQTRNYDFSSDGIYSVHIVQKIDSVDFPNGKPEYFNEDELKPFLEYDLTSKGKYKLSETSIQFIPEQVSASGSDFVDFEEFVGVNEAIDSVLEGFKMVEYPNSEGVMTIDSIKYKKSE